MEMYFSTGQSPQRAVKATEEEEEEEEERECRLLFYLNAPPTSQCTAGLLFERSQFSLARPSEQ
jgi:hypothetical protein